MRLQDTIEIPHSVRNDMVFYFKKGDASPLHNSNVVIPNGVRNLTPS
jgi:hypothetical protein